MASLIRIVPTQQFCGTLAPRHRPVAFFADSHSLAGLSVAEAYRRVHGVGLEESKPYFKHSNRTPFLQMHMPAFDEYDEVMGNPCIRDHHLAEFQTKEDLSNTRFLVFQLPEESFGETMILPATWESLAYILVNPNAAGIPEPEPGCPPEKFAYEWFQWEFVFVRMWFLEMQREEREILPRLRRSSPSALGLNMWNSLPGQADQLPYYHFISKSSLFTDRVVRLFGLYSRCWHGCGFIGWEGFPVVRLFFVRNGGAEGFHVSEHRGHEKMPKSV